MKKPRDIDWCYVTEAMAKDPSKKMSEHLPDKRMTTTREWMIYLHHVNVDKCKRCNDAFDEIERKTPPERRQPKPDLN